MKDNMEQYDDSSFRQTMNLKVTDKMMAKIQYLAKIEDRSDSDVVRDLIRQSLDAYGDIFNLDGPVLDGYNPSSSEGTGPSPSRRGNGR